MENNNSSHPKVPSSTVVNEMAERNLEHSPYSRSSNPGYPLTFRKDEAQVDALKGAFQPHLPYQDMAAGSWDFSVGSNTSVKTEETSKSLPAYPVDLLEDHGGHTDNRSKLDLSVPFLPDGTMDLCKKADGKGHDKDGVGVQEQSLNLSMSKPVFPGSPYQSHQHAHSSSTGKVLTIRENEDDIMDAANLIMTLRDQELPADVAAMNTAYDNIMTGHSNYKVEGRAPHKRAHTHVHMHDKPYRHPFYDYRIADNRPNFDELLGDQAVHHSSSRGSSFDDSPTQPQAPFPVAMTTASSSNPTASKQPKYTTQSYRAEDRPFACHLCDYRSIHKSSLDRHMKVHSHEKPFQCPLCDSRFIQAEHLDTHLRNHTTDKPYMCSLCDYKTAHKYNLDCHLKLHSGPKPHKCSYCDSWFTQRASLVRHTRTHTGEKPHQCSYCEKRFSEKANLVTHLRTHTGEKPYTCPHCDYKSAQHTPLARHLRTHSRDKQ